MASFVTRSEDIKEFGSCDSNWMGRSYSSRWTDDVYTNSALTGPMIPRYNESRYSHAYHPKSYIRDLNSMHTC
jgi:hypothetical protein